MICGVSALFRASSCFIFLVLVFNFPNKYSAGVCSILISLVEKHRLYCRILPWSFLCVIGLSPLCVCECVPVTLGFSESSLGYNCYVFFIFHFYLGMISEQLKARSCHRREKICPAFLVCVCVFVFFS